MGSELKRQRLDITRIQAELQGSYWRVKTLEEVASTQDLLKHENVRSGDVIAAEFQNKGRGRLDRSFDVAPFAGLLFSVYIEPKRPIDEWGWIPLLVGMTAAEVLNNQTNSRIFTTKWPNDVLGSKGKVAGILAETFRTGVVIGIGINVSLLETELPVTTASSIYLESGIELDRNELLPSLLNALFEVFAEFDDGKSQASRYLSLCSTIGKKVEIVQPNSHPIHAIAYGISESGGLMLDSGVVVTVGDVVHLRA